MDFSIGVSYKTSKVLPAESVVRENNSEPANPKCWVIVKTDR